MHFPSFLVYCIIVTSTPGPTNIAILSIAANAGAGKTIRYVSGAASALLMLLLLSALLGSAITSVVPGIMTFMRILGSLYMLYLAYMVLRMDVSGALPRQAATYWSGFAMQLINPKIWLLTMTVLPSFVMPYYTNMFVLMGFALAVTVIACGAFALWALIGKALVRFLQKHRKAVNITLAVLLFYSALEVSGLLSF